MIKINIDKAKQIQKNMMRVVRKPLLEKLDVDFVDWKPFITSYGDEINNWANIHLKIENE